jgi:Domain of unknown function (DUF4331)
MRLRKLSIALGGAALGVAVLGAIPAFGADHRDAPLTKAAAKSDITDVYAFTGAGGTAVFDMNVNPLTSPADTPNLSLDPATVYEFKMDTNGDAVPDISYKLTVSGTGPVQDFTLRKATGSDAVTNGVAGSIVATGKTSSGSGVTPVAIAGGGQVYIGPRDDPFYFDLAAFQAGLKFTNPGVDTFKGTNITAIVLEFPTAPAMKMGVWGTTSKQDPLGNWVQLDRMGRPAINTVFIPAEKKDAFNNNTPDRDVAIYKADVVAALASLGAGPGLADVLLPDILTVDFSQPTKYLNGRGLSDDVIDISLQAITGNSAASDHVDSNDRAFLPAFPYLAMPNTAAPGAPNTGTGIATSDRSTFSWRWTLPAGLIAAAALMAAAGLVNRRRESGVEA